MLAQYRPGPPPAVPVRSSSITARQCSQSLLHLIHVITATPNSYSGKERIKMHRAGKKAPWTNAVRQLACAGTAIRVYYKSTQPSDRVDSAGTVLLCTLGSLDKA